MVGGSWEQALSLTSQAQKGKRGKSEVCPGLALAWGAVQLGLAEQSSQSGTQLSASRNRGRGAFEARINVFSHKEGENKIHVEPSHTANEKETGLQGGSRQGARWRGHFTIELFLLMQ